MIFRKRTGPKSVIRHLGLPETPIFLGGKRKKKYKGFTGCNAYIRRPDTLPLRQMEELKSYFYRSGGPIWRNINMREMSNFMDSRQPPPNFNRNLLSLSTAELNASNRAVKKVITTRNRRDMTQNN